jgi:hypothetical protein
MATVFVEVRFLMDAPSIIGSDLKVYGPFVKGRVYALPKANAAVFIRNKVAVATREEAKKPTLKELFKGEVLDGYVEAAVSKPLVEPEKKPTEEELMDYVVEELVGLGLPDEEIDPESRRIIQEALRQPNPREYAEKEVKIIEEREIAKLEEEPRRVGYRVGEPQEIDAKKVIEFEVLELGNEHLLTDLAKALSTEPKLPSINRAIDEQFGVDAEAMWLCDTPAQAQRRYGPGEAYEVEIPVDAIVGSDLGPDGKLWIWLSRKDLKQVKAALQERLKRVRQEVSREKET